MDIRILIGGGVILITIYGFVMRAIEKRTGLNLYDMQVPEDLPEEFIDSPQNANNNGYIIDGHRRHTND